MGSNPTRPSIQRRETVTLILLLAIGLAIFVVPDPWRIPVVAGGIVLELAETALEIRWSRRGRARVGAETVIGAIGTVISDCRPEGQVRVNGESWLARCPTGAVAGERVRVTEREGLTLVVEPVEPG